MEAAIRKIVSEFEANPMLGAKGLRELFQANRDSFFSWALPLLRENADSPGFQYLLTFLLSQGLLLKRLCDPAVFTLDESIRIAKCVRLIDPQFDIRLLRSLVQNNGSTTPQELGRLAGSPAGIRLLDIMGEVSDGSRVLPTMTQLLNHSDSHVRSKAALLVGRSNKNHKWVQEKLSEPDARVRANAVESLWGADNAGSRGVFWTALGDDDNRVVANAMLGLYRLGDPASVRLILQLLSHPEEPFRASAVWVMGESGDPRFIPLLAKMISEPVPELRGNAFRALSKIKKASAQRSAGEPLNVYLSPPKPAKDGWFECTAAVRGRGRQPMPNFQPTNFAVWEDCSLVGEYDVRQRGKHEPLAVAIGLPRAPERGPAQVIQEDAIDRALRYKRKGDVWMVLKYISNPNKTGSDQEAGSQGPGDEDLATLRMRFTTDPDIISNAVTSPGRRLGCASDLHQATRTLIEASRLMRAARNVILICQSPTDTFTHDVDEEIEAALRAGVAVHVISPWPTEIMAKLCTLTGGTLMPTEPPGGLKEAVEVICATLLNSYELRYKPVNLGAEKVRLQVYNDTLIGEGCRTVSSAAVPQ